MFFFTSYHHHLTHDQERLAGFYEAITNVKGTVFDIGSGSGILSALAASYAHFIYSVEVDPNVSKKTRLLLKNYDNVSFINEDARKVDFQDKADFILCEMLDTALIDEEQVPVLNSLLKYLKKDGKVIPYGVLNGMEPVHTRTGHICYQESESPDLEVLGPLNNDSQYKFGKYINPQAEIDLKLKITREGLLTGIKITTFTLITPGIITGPTPMMNPPLIIPTEKLKVKSGDTVQLYISYQMGGGLDTIKTRIEKITTGIREIRKEL
ncbi:MAG TPA: methyltransferase domain-containing protein [Methanobacterium sp.]|nr:methyltransferase domain-containing protein [Methanobacterium sp.]